MDDKHGGLIAEDRGGVYEQNVTRVYARFGERRTLVLEKMHDASYATLRITEDAVLDKPARSCDLKIKTEEDARRVAAVLERVHAVLTGRFGEVPAGEFSAAALEEDLPELGGDE